MKRPQVCVLMSTYNGETYLSSQLDSIFAQQGVDTHVVVRDDGSHDRTLTVLDEYQSIHSLRHYTGPNLGPARSFMQLLADADHADYYAFSDQDDYWMPDKLESAVAMLSDDEDTPALYFCQTQLADAQLHPLPLVRINPEMTFAESLIYQFIGGCTMVMNNAMRDIVTRYTPKTLFMHDVWIYCIAQSVGAKVYFDPKPHMLYRQHGANVVGQGFGFMTSLKRRFNRVFGGSHIRHTIACELMQGYKDLMPAENVSILDRVVNYNQGICSRLALLTDSRFHCSHQRTYRLFKLAILLGSF